jgi:hypothetical protein
MRRRRQHNFSKTVALLRVFSYSIPTARSTKESTKVHTEYTLPTSILHTSEVNITKVERQEWSSVINIWGQTLNLKNPKPENPLHPKTLRNLNPKTLTLVHVWE